MEQEDKNSRILPPQKHLGADFPVQRVAQVLSAVAKTTGVQVGLLDALGEPSEFDSTGMLRPTGQDRVLPIDIIKKSHRQPRPVLHADSGGSASIAIPFALGPATGGFVVAWGFAMVAPAEAQASALNDRFTLGSPLDTLTAADGLDLLDYDKLSILTDLLEAAAAQITLLINGCLRNAFPGGVSAPMSQAVFSAIRELHTNDVSTADAAEARRTSERLQAIYDSTQDAILMLDRDLKIVAANREFGRLFGTDADAFLGVTGTWLRRWLIKNAKDPSRVSTTVDELLMNSSAVLDDEIELLSPHHMILRFYSAPVTDKNEQNIGRLLVFRDITLFRKSRHDMIGSEKMSLIGRVAAGLAHELNNILAGMLTYADYALEDGDSEKIRGALKMSIAAAEKASELVHKFLTVSGPSENRPQDVDIHLELERLLDTVAKKFKADNIRIHKLLEAVPRVYVDPVQMQQAFHNILDNAREAIGHEGAITVRTEADWDQSKVRVLFTDSGPGIPPEFLDRMMDPFFTTKGVVSGGGSTGAKGLGLAVAKGIVESYGGKIYAGNVLPHGASIVIELPLAGADVPAAPPPSVY